MMAEEMTTNRAEAIERAKKHPAGMFVNVHRRVLQAMEMLGLAELAADGEFYLTDKGRGESKPEESKVEEPAENATVRMLKEEFDAISDNTPVGMERVNATVRGMLRQKYAEGAAWAIQELRASAAAAQRSYESTQEKDYKRMEETLRTAANVLAMDLRKRLIDDREEV
ncbi:hypothetical protein EV284_3505 [Streptomyces sp. BK022]|uniref:hypothetical protein n=1 Tax=Streptomyces sp. BK022 TaxID=2512123 RepID=UPI0010291F20|nr:hypothetical protein [Streptomyces sp. BK022]RZU36022.1 hypothetical protein EV284_3505 [Streptomyces sp. BK022]